MKRELPQLGKAYRAALVPEIRSIDDEARTIDFVASTEAVDRYGDIIRVAGWKLDNYKRNPIFLWAHKSGEPPIGKTVGIHTESNPPALVQKVEFADKETYPFADVIFNLYKGKFLRAVSVGFLPLEMPKRIKDAEDNTTGWEFINQELLELSAVPVPANPEAVARMVSKGFGTEADLERVFSGPAMTAEAVYREVAEINHEIARIAVSLAKATLLKANEVRALLEARGLQPEAGGELAWEELLAAVKSSKAPAPGIEIEGDEITNMAELGAALGVGDGIEEFERSLGLGGSR
jgi:HK97 family phage prohead protease